MPVSSLSAARWICKTSKWRITNLELQKLLYLAHMYHIGRTPDNSPLVREEFEAWDYGPVLPTVYHAVKGFGAEPIRDVFYRVPDITDDEIKNSLREVYDALKDASPSRLVAMTHRDGGAWSVVYDHNSRGKKIPNSLILKEYQSLVNDDDQ